jgi:class 3 adenylate cyclase
VVRRLNSAAGLPSLPGAPPSDLEQFSALERDHLIRRWRVFAPLCFVLFFLSEAAAWISPEFPKAPLLTGSAMSVMATMYLLARRRVRRAVMGWATVGAGIFTAFYIATAAADTGRFHSMQILAMAVLIAFVPGLLTLTLIESIAVLSGSIVAYFLTLRWWHFSGAPDLAGLTTGATYLIFLAVTTAITTVSNRRLRFREFVARRQVERIHRFAVEEVLCRHLPPRYVERVLSGQSPLDAPPERRLVTVLFADLVGFTKLTDALTPEELAELMARFYDVAASVAFEHGATIDKFIGDAVMALLGAPEPMTPVEQAYNALAVARGWLEAVGALEAAGKPLEMRVGIHQDTVAAGMFGGRLRSDYTVLGRGVNVAARLQQKSGAGEILVSGELRDQLGDDVEVEDLGELALRGVARPVRVFKIL